jgi:D5 N terminal like
VSDAQVGPDVSDFALPPALAEKVWGCLNAIKIAPTSEKLDAFRRATQLVSGLTGPDFPTREAVERLWAMAECNGLIEAYDEDIVQAALAEGLSNPIFSDEADETTENGSRPPAFTDEALALRFAERHVGFLRYVAAWSKWMVWDGRCWQYDDTLRAFDLAREVCREAAAECKKLKVAGCLASAKTVAAVERLAKADRRLAATAEQWDSNPWLLNTPGGVIDLRTGVRRGHRPCDYLTQITAVTPEGRCPTWHSFLDRVTAGDESLKEFLQRMTGSSCR